MESAIDRHVFYTSNGTTITVEALGYAVMSQFPVVTSSVTLLFVENISRARVVKEQTDAIYQQTGIRPLVLYFIVIPRTRDIILQSGGFCQDIVQALMAPLQQELNFDLTPVVHHTHGLNPGNLTKYDARIAAINYTLAHDDGISLRNLDQVQAILLGVPRHGKTPTSLYPAMQYGICVANYPFIADDMDNLVLPALLEPLQHEMFDLTTNPERLAVICEERRENSRYASLRQRRMEVTEMEALYRKNRIPYLNSTNYSVEEITTKIMGITGLNRRTYQHTSTLLKTCLCYHPWPIQDHVLLLQ